MYHYHLANTCSTLLYSRRSGDSFAGKALFHEKVRELKRRVFERCFVFGRVGGTSLAKLRCMKLYLKGLHHSRNFKKSIFFYWLKKSFEPSRIRDKRFYICQKSFSLKFRALSRPLPTAPKRLPAVNTTPACRVQHYVLPFDF